MSGKRQFDYDEAMTAATRLFWAKGYSKTSLRGLLGAMEIGEGSFYNTVKSKKHLYVECLKHYNDTVSRRRLEALLSRESVKEGIRAFFKTVLDELDDPEGEGDKSCGAQPGEYPGCQGQKTRGVRKLDQSHEPYLIRLPAAGNVT